jgi:hypothetical protein
MNRSPFTAQELTYLPTVGEPLPTWLVRTQSATTTGSSRPLRVRGADLPRPHDEVRAAGMGPGARPLDLPVPASPSSAHQPDRRPLPIAIAIDLLSARPSSAARGTPRRRKLNVEQVWREPAALFHANST